MSIDAAKLLINFNEFDCNTNFNESDWDSNRPVGRAVTLSSLEREV